MQKDDWIAPFSVKILHNFLEKKYYQFFYNLIKSKTFYQATQGLKGKQVVEENHKIRKDYTLTLDEFSVIDKLVLISIP